MKTVFSATILMRTFSYKQKKIVFFNEEYRVSFTARRDLSVRAFQILGFVHNYSSNRSQKSQQSRRTAIEEVEVHPIQPCSESACKLSHLCLNVPSIIWRSSLANLFRGFIHTESKDESNLQSTTVHARRLKQRGQICAGAYNYWFSKWNCLKIRKDVATAVTVGLHRGFG